MKRGSNCSECNDEGEVLNMKDGRQEGFGQKWIWKRICRRKEVLFQSQRRLFCLFCRVFEWRVFHLPAVTPISGVTTFYLKEYVSSSSSSLINTKDIWTSFTSFREMTGRGRRFNNTFYRHIRTRSPLWLRERENDISLIEDTEQRRTKNRTFFFIRVYTHCWCR